VFFFPDEDFFHQNSIIGPKGNMKEDPRGESGKGLQMPVSIEKQASSRRQCIFK
jgi:hypothetical protein